MNLTPENKSLDVCHESRKKGPRKKGLRKKGPGKKGSGKKSLKTSKNDHLPKWLEIMKI